MCNTVCSYVYCVYIQTHNTQTKDTAWREIALHIELQLSARPTLGPGTMSVICYSVLRLLPLLIATATITLGTRPVRRDATEGESTSTGGCISDWIGLKKAYLERQSSADVENSIFDFYPSDAISFGVLVMFYDMGPPPNTSTSGRRECCQRGSKDCFIYFIYSHTSFRDIHPRLFYSRAGHKFTSSSSYETRQLCWAPPPLCRNESLKAMLQEFSTQVRMYIIILFY